MSKTKMGNIYGFQKGHTIRKGMISPMKGKHHTEEIKKKLKLVHLGKKHSQKTKDKIGLASKKRIGELSGNWQGGISTENNKIRASLKFRLWRKLVFERDKYICQRCKVKGKQLHPHHIFDFAQFITFRFELFNGITLCEKCHIEFHKIYGRTNNNREQIETFTKTVDK